MEFRGIAAQSGQFRNLSADYFKGLQKLQTGKTAVPGVAFPF